MSDESVFAAALEKPTSAQQAAFLDGACAGNPALRQRVEARLRAHQQAAGCLPNPAATGPFEPSLPHPTLSGEGNGPREASPATEAPGTRIGPYRLVEQIGEGGFGVVFVAEQQVPVRRKVALKLIKPGMDSKQVVARFDAERQALAMMDHPNIARVLDAGATDSGRPYFVMELVRGVPITAYCDDNHLTTTERLELFVSVCHAIQHAHQKGVIHRDIKPSNVLVTSHDDKPVAKVIDFGVAKAIHQQLTDLTLHTSIAQMVGTPLYMSPEQAAMGGLDIDTRSDIYSLGVLLYELLTGSTPLAKNRVATATYDELRRLIREEEPQKPSKRLSTSNTLSSVASGRNTEPARLSRMLRGELDWIVLKALEKDRARRYETASALARDIQRYLADEVVEARPPSTGYRLRKFARKHRAGLTTAVALVLLLVAGIAVSTWLAVRATRAEADARAAEQAEAERAEGERRANAELAARNRQLADEQAKVQARFELAQKAIALFHTGVSQDALLRNAEFKELRTKLLRQAAGFYADLEKLLAGQTDAKSRKALAAAYFQLGELTDKIGTKPEALAVHRKALAVRRELAAAEGADVETRLDVARSLRAEGILLYYTGDPAGALRAWEEQRDIATALAAESANDAARAVLAKSHNTIGVLLMETGKPAEALEAFEKALAIQQQLADADPAISEYQSDLALSHNNIGTVRLRMGKPEDALTAWGKALAINQNLADAHPAVADFQSAVAGTHNNIGDLLSQTGKPAEALQAHQKVLAIRQKLADARPAVADFQSDVAASHSSIGYMLSQMGKPAEALQAHQKALAIRQKLADAHPAVTKFQRVMAQSHNLIGRLLACQQRFAEAFTAIDAGLAIRQKLASADPKNTEYAIDLGYSHAYRGWALVRSGEPSSATADLRQAVELWAKAKAPNTETRFERSRALALLAGLGGLGGPGGDANSGVTAAEAAKFADQAVAALRDAISAGWNKPDELKEPDFDALRGREDFKKLVADLEARK